MRSKKRKRVRELSQPKAVREKKGRPKTKKAQINSAKGKRNYLTAREKGPMKKRKGHRGDQFLEYGQEEPAWA